VLLTRARQGMIIFVPKGSPPDPTNSPEEFDATALYLLRCGVTPLDRPDRFDKSMLEIPAEDPFL
ncbi:MAG: hypothetical protein ACRD3F_14540, partial [Acidobacteriaceae bacterium]